MIQSAIRNAPKISRKYVIALTQSGRTDAPSTHITKDYPIVNPAHLGAL
jgi:hypothetical protein